jgi:hypothetical protein
MLAAISCGAGVVDPITSAAGTYTLRSANGALPFRFYHVDASGQTTIDITSGTLVLRKEGTFEEVLHYHSTPPAPQVPYDTPVTTDGTFMVDKAVIAFTYTRPGGEAYTWSGSILAGGVTYFDPSFTDVPAGLTAEYTRQ